MIMTNLQKQKSQPRTFHEHPSECRENRVVQDAGHHATQHWGVGPPHPDKKHQFGGGEADAHMSMHSGSGGGQASEDREDQQRPAHTHEAHDAPNISQNAQGCLWILRRSTGGLLHQNGKVRKVIALASDVRAIVEHDATTLVAPR